MPNYSELIAVVALVVVLNIVLAIFVLWLRNRGNGAD